MRRVRNASADSLHSFIVDSVEAGSSVHTDGWDGYSGLDRKGYTHEVTPLTDRGKSASKLLPRVHRVASLVKRWLSGTHQGAISREHLNHYLDEYTFRFNRRASHYRGKLFYRLVQQALTVGPVPYKLIVKHVRGRRPKHHNL